MKHLFFFMFVTVASVLAGPQCFAQVREAYNSPQREEDNRLRLQKADSVYQLRNERVKETRRALSIAKSELKAAQINYNQANSLNKQAVSSAREAKKAYKMEQKAQKAQLKASKHAQKAGFEPEL